MVLSDDHGYTDIGTDIDSNVVTPVLADLRRNGMHLANGYATAAQCVPSRAGLLSGRHQSTFGTLTLTLTLTLTITLSLSLGLSLSLSLSLSLTLTAGTRTPMGSGGMGWTPALARARCRLART
eukprot:scaffold98696_cov30-Phaeocystis_antarctica.AAC.1